nr:odorant receptor 47 [Psyttalia incisi]
MLRKRQFPSNHRNNSALNFKRLFNICRVSLRMAGIIGIDSIYSRSKRRISDFKGFYYVITILPSIIVLTCEIRSTIYFWKQDIYLALEIFMVILSSFVVVIQGFVMYFLRRKIVTFVGEVSRLWNEQLMADIGDDIVKPAKNAESLTKIYAALVILLGSSYTLRPYFSLLVQFGTKNENDTYDLSQTAYPAMYPFPTDTVGRYLLCVTVELVLFINVAAWWTASDMLFLQLATHLSLQYQRLKKDFMEITSHESRSPEHYSASQQLISIGQRHNHLLLLSRQLKQIFSPILFCLMIVTGANICICIISLQKEILCNNTAGIIKCLVHTSLTMIQPAIYCKYANDLSESAELIATAAFQCNWVNQRRNFKQYLQLMIFSAQRGITFNIWGFFSVNLNQLTRV